MSDTSEPEEHPEIEFPVMAIITVRYDGDDGVLYVDTGGIDPWSSHTMLMQATEAVYDSLPYCSLSDMEEVEEEQEPGSEP